MDTGALVSYPPPLGKLDRVRLNNNLAYNYDACTPVWLRTTDDPEG